MLCMYLVTKIQNHSNSSRPEQLRTAVIGDLAEVITTLKTARQGVEANFSFEKNMIDMMR